MEARGRRRPPMGATYSAAAGPSATLYYVPYGDIAVLREFLRLKDEQGGGPALSAVNAVLKPDAAVEAAVHEFPTIVAFDGAGKETRMGDVQKLRAWLSSCDHPPTMHSPADRTTATHSSAVSITSAAMRASAPGCGTCTTSDRVVDSGCTSGAVAQAASP